MKRDEAMGLRAMCAVCAVAAIATVAASGTSACALDNPLTVTRAERAALPAVEPN